MIEKLKKSVDEIMSELSMAPQLNSIKDIELQRTVFAPQEPPANSQAIFELMEKKLKDQEKLASIGKIAGLMPHELLNPIDAMRRYLNLAYNRNLTTEQSLEYIRKARLAMDRMTQMIQCVLTFSGCAFGIPKPLNVNTLIEDKLAELVPQNSGITIKTLYDPRIGDMTLPAFEFVIHHLIQNAAEAMNSGGLLTILTQRLETDIKIFIRDTGGGIPQDYGARIFEPFFTTKRDCGNLGLGLTIAQEVVERSSGRLQIYNQYGKSLTCIIYIPVSHFESERSNVS